MTKFSSKVACCTLGLALVLGGCAAPSKDAPVDANWLQRMEGVVRQAAPALQVRVQPSVNPVKLGEALKVRVFSNTAGFVYLLQLDSDHNVLRMVFPNADDDANFMGAGYMDLPRGAWRMHALAPTGVAYLMVVISPTQLDLAALQAQLAYGRFELLGAYGASMVPLRRTKP